MRVSDRGIKLHMTFKVANSFHHREKQKIPLPYSLWVLLNDTSTDIDQGCPAFQSEAYIKGVT